MLSSVQPLRRGTSNLKPSASGSTKASGPKTGSRSVQPGNEMKDVQPQSMTHDTSAQGAEPPLMEPRSALEHRK